MNVREFSTGCGDLLLSGFSIPSNPDGSMIYDADRQPLAWNTNACQKWLDDCLTRGSFGDYHFYARAFVIAILNPAQEKLYGHIFEKHGFSIISEGVNDNHNHVLTLRAKVNKKDGKRIALWHAEKATWFQNWFQPIKAVVEKVMKKYDASGRTGKVLQRKVAVSAPE